MLPNYGQTREGETDRINFPREKWTSHTTDLELSWEAQCQIGEFCLSSLDSVEQNQELFAPGTKMLILNTIQTNNDMDSLWNQSNVIPRMSLVLDPTCCSHFLGIQDQVVQLSWSEWAIQYYICLFQYELLKNEWKEPYLLTPPGAMPDIASSKAGMTFIIEKCHYWDRHWQNIS